MHWHAYHLQHSRSARAEKADHQHGSNEQEDDVEHGGIIPLHPFSDPGHIAVLWDNPQCREQELNHIACCGHRHIEGDENIAHDLLAVVFAVDVQDWQDDQVGKNEAHHTSKANPTAPQNRGQGYIAYGADETDHRDQWLH